MKDTEYYKSGKHKENALAARELALVKTNLLKQERICLYDQSPETCHYCQNNLDYEHRKNKFCSKSCAASFNNQKRPAGSTSRLVQATKITGKKQQKSKKGVSTARVCKISWHTCQVCCKTFYTKMWSSPRKTCGSPECITHLKVGHRPYTNGRRKLFKHYNKWTNNVVLLESSWEKNLAEWLDYKMIEWTRPSPIKWKDSKTSKTRLYYPDFFLPKFNLYLDPKNPTAMKNDEHKMSIVSETIDVIYGNLDYIKSHIDKLIST